MKYEYLLINFLTMFFPVALSFDKRVGFYKSWKFIWPGLTLTGLIFLCWDVLFTLKGVWSFNPLYITGLKILELPIEEILFFLTVPFACIFIYCCLNYYVRQELSAAVTQITSGILIILSTVILFFFYKHLYTLVTFSILLLLVIILQFGLRVKWLGKFYRAYFASLIPFYIVNGILTSVPIVLYNNAEDMALRVGTIPFEDHFYSMCLLLMNIGFFEYFRSKQATK